MYLFFLLLTNILSHANKKKTPLFLDNLQNQHNTYSQQFRLVRQRFIIGSIKNCLRRKSNSQRWCSLIV